ncbi:MAG: CvpA family protein [Tepidisphaeraceae bacterium]
MSFLFNLVVLLALLGVAYIHWIQGLFSSAISMVCAIVAAAMALSYSETIITSYLGGAMANYANAMTLPVVFAVIYLVLRLIFDMLVPGNVRVPHLMDKIGGGVCGFIAGIFSVGTVVLAAQYLPVGPSIMMWSRYETEDRDSVAPVGSREEDVKVYDVMKQSDQFKLAGEESGLWFPVDRWVAGFVKGQAGTGPGTGGALANGRSFAAIHPDLPNELFFQRLGTPLGTKRVGLPFVHQIESSVVGNVRWLKQVREADSQTKNMRGSNYLEPAKTPRVPDAGRVLIAVPMTFSADAGEKDNIIRMSPGQLRLVGPMPSSKTYYPIGTLYRGNVLIRERLDDMIYIDEGKRKHADETGAAVFVFEVDPADVLVGDDKEKDNFKFKPGTFLEFRRYNYMPLADRAVVKPDLDAFPDGSGFKTRINKMIDEGGQLPKNANDPVFRRPTMLKEYNLLDRGPESTDPDQ